MVDRGGSGLKRPFDQRQIAFDLDGVQTEFLKGTHAHGIQAGQHDPIGKPRDGGVVADMKGLYGTLATNRTHPEHADLVPHPCIGTAEHCFEHLGSALPVERRCRIGKERAREQGLMGSVFDLPDIPARAVAATQFVAVLRGVEYGDGKLVVTEKNHGKPNVLARRPV